MPKIIKIEQVKKKKNLMQIIMNTLKFNRDFTPHAANKLFSLIRHQAARGAIEEDRLRYRQSVLVKKTELL